MKLKRKIRIAAVSALSLFVLLFIVLVVHIALAPPLEPDNATLQVCRIDFDQPLDQAKAAEVTANLKSIHGITSDNIIVKRNVVVYFIDNRKTDSRKVFAELMAKGDYHAKPFFVSEKLASTPVCPAMDPNSFTYKFGVRVQKIFN